MEARWLEIQFCYFIKNLFNKYHGNIAVLDIVEIICGIAKCDETVIKSLIRQVRSGEGIINTTHLETMYFALQKGMSFRDITKLAGLGQYAQYTFRNRLAEKDWGFQNSTQHTTPMEYENLKAFMDVVFILGDIIGGITCKK